MSAPMNHPVIIDPEATVKDRLLDLLNDLDFGREPGTGASDAEKAQVEADREVIRAAMTGIEDAETDLDADRVFMLTMATLAARGCKRSPAGAAGPGRRHRVAAGARIVSDRSPLPAFEAAAQHLGMQGSPIPARSPEHLAQVGGAR